MISDKKLKQLDVFVKEHLIFSANRSESINLRYLTEFEEAASYSAVCCKESVDNFVENTRKPSFHELLFKYIDDKNLVDSFIYKRAGIDRRHFSKMRAKEYRPGKKTVLLLGLALELNLDSMLDLLAAAGYTLSDSDKSDLVVKFCVINGIYRLMDVNIALNYMGLETF